MATQNDFPAFFPFPYTLFHISVLILPYFPTQPFIFPWTYFHIFLHDFSQFLLQQDTFPFFGQKIGRPSVFGHLWPTFLESSVVMQICFQISIVYPPSALSASVCLVAVAGAGLSLQIQFSLKIRATLSSSSPGYFIASFCPASRSFYPPPCTHSAKIRVLSWFGDPKHFNELSYIATRSLKVVIFDRLGSADFLAELGSWESTTT